MSEPAAHLLILFLVVHAALTAKHWQQILWAAGFVIGLLYSWW